MKPVNHIMADLFLHYTTVCTFSPPGLMQVKTKYPNQRHLIPQEGSDLGSIAHIMSESHVWLYTKPVVCWKMGQQRTITLILNPNRAFWDLCWEGEANPASPDQSHRCWIFYRETARGDEDRMWRPSEVSLVNAGEFSEQEERACGDWRRLCHMFRSEQHGRHVHKHKPGYLM